MGRKRVIAKRIIRVLKRAYEPLTFKEIRERLNRPHVFFAENKVTDRSIDLNLKYLLENHVVMKVGRHYQLLEEELPGVDTWLKQKILSIADFHFSNTVRTVVEEKEQDATELEKLLTLIKAQLRTWKKMLEEEK